MDDDSGSFESGSWGQRNARATYESLVNTLPISLLIKDLEGKRLFANSTYLKTRGLSLQDVLGKSDYDLFPYEIASLYSADDAKVIETATVLHNVEQSISSAGDIRWIERIKSPIVDDHDRVIGVQIVFWDVTDRHLTEQELRHERQLLTALLKNIPDCIYFKDLQSRFLRISSAMAQKFGFESEEEVIGKTDADIFSRSHAEEARADELEIIQSGQPLVNVTERETWHDREDSWCVSTKMPLRGVGGDVIGTFGISRDITELKKYEDQLRQARDAADAANRAKSDFLANMSHEIRTPMNAIIGMSELLGQSRLDVQQSEYVGLIRDSAESLLRILNEILDFSKIESHKLELESIPFSLRDLIEKSARTFAFQAAEKRIELACRVAPELPDRWLGDPGRLRQVMINLIGNAIKFTDDGEIVVDVRMGTATEQAPVGTTPIRFSVRDTGIGIPEEKLASVLDPFTQADGSTTRRFGGTGLGLTIAKQLVELMYGNLELTSRVGFGTEFFFQAALPLAENQTIDDDAQRHLLRGMRVMVVDDNPTNRTILKEVLRRWELDVTAVGSGAEALEVLQASKSPSPSFQFVVLDCMMPEMDGFQLAERIRAIFPDDTLKLIMLSSARRHEDARRSQRLGIARLMAKPVVQSELLDTVLQVMGARPEPAAKTTQDVPACLPMRVLVAEDGLANQKVAVGLLHASGHRSVVVENGRQAVTRWRDEPFDVILMDMHMPIMDGIEATKEIRNQEKGSDRRIPIIALTAAAMQDDADLCFNAGMDGYLSKPIHQHDLQSMLAQFAPKESVLDSMPIPDGESDHRPAANDSPAVKVNLNRDDVLSRDSEAIDIAAAASRVPGGLRGLRELAEVFIKECLGLMASLREGIPDGDSKDVQRCAHTLKGSAALFYANQVADGAKAIESCAKAGNLKDAVEHLERLESSIEEMFDELNRFLVSTEGGEM